MKESVKQINRENIQYMQSLLDLEKAGFVVNEGKLFTAKRFG